MLCQMRESIPIDIFSKSASGSDSFLVHHPSLKSLESSAKDGCSICVLICDNISKIRHQVPEHHNGDIDVVHEQEVFTSYQNTVSKEGHRPQLSVRRYKLTPSSNEFTKLVYKVGRNGAEHYFDVESSGR